MGRKSALSNAQWLEIERRIIVDGESINSLAAEFGINESSIRRKIKPNKAELTELAQMKAQAQKYIKDIDQKIEALPIPKQQIVSDLVFALTEVSTNLASAAAFGARTAHKLAAIAHTQTEALNDYDPMANPDALKAIAVLSDMANSASQTGLNLIRANKEAVDTLNQRSLAPEPVTEIEVVIVDPKDRNAPGIRSTP